MNAALPPHPACVQESFTAPRHAWRSLLPLAACIALYFVLALWIAATKAPWCDEGWFACPAYNLAFRGKMATNVLEPSGHFLNAYLKGIQERTYIVVPNHLIALAGWFRLFGFSMFIMRAYSIVWGAIELLLLYYILVRLFPDRRVAQTAVFLLATDFIFLWSTADGRMEAPATALALACIASWLHFRERNLGTAVIVSQMFGAAAVFTHPNALIGVIAVIVLALRYDREQLRLWHVFAAAGPYCVFLVLWSFYIVQSPSDFVAQFFANAAGRASSRWKTIIQPWLALWKEGTRHVGAYVGSGIWSGIMSQWMLFVPFIYIGALSWFWIARRKRDLGSSMFFLVTGTYVLGMTFLNGFKAFCYLIYLIPFYDSALAMLLVTLWQGAPDRKLIGASLATAFLMLQVSATVQHIRADEYHLDYLPAVHSLEAYRSAGKTITGTTALGMDFSGFRDDARLGMYTGSTSDLVVIDRSYRSFSRLFAEEEPAVFSHVVSTLTSKFRLVELHGSFWIFERLRGDKPAAPWVDISAIALKAEDEKADYFYKLLASSAEAYSQGRRTLP
jgi:hypothetical protein